MTTPTILDVVYGLFGGAAVCWGAGPDPATLADDLRRWA